jgi:outer membrane protein OmpA-like peptidoglycan-associated protein
VTYDSLGREIVLIDDLVEEVRVDVTTLPAPTRGRVTISSSEGDAELKAALARIQAEELGRTFSLRQIREIPQVRALAATVEVNAVTFDSGSAAIKASEAAKLADLGGIVNDLIALNPGEIFLIEGHTDAVGSASSNLTLSDRRAESVARALTEYFNVPPENLVVQGYGEGELLIPTQGDERANRRVAVRIITPLMRSAALQ